MGKLITYDTYYITSDEVKCPDPLQKGQDLTQLGNKTEEKHVAKKKHPQSNAKAASFPSAKIPVMNEELKTKEAGKYYPPPDPQHNRTIWEKAKRSGNLL